MKLEKLNSEKFKIFESSKIQNVESVLGGYDETDGPDGKFDEAYTVKPGGQLDDIYFTDSGSASHDEPG